MPPDPVIAAYLWDMLDAAKDIAEFVKDLTQDQFSGDKKTRFAVERQLLVIGEAANHVAEEFKTNHSDIPWNKITGLRNIIAHAYGEVLVERIWLVATEHLPVLIKKLEDLLRE